MPEAFDRTLDAETAGPSVLPRVQPEPHLVVALECDRPLASSSRHRLGLGGNVAIGRGAARGATRSGDYRATELSLRVPDPRMSSAHARLSGALGRWKLVDAGSKNGVRVNDSVVREHVLADGDLIELGHTLFL